jgi:hypothetical protein
MNPSTSTVAAKLMIQMESPNMGFAAAAAAAAC